MDVFDIYAMLCKKITQSSGGITGIAVGADGSSIDITYGAGGKDNVPFPNQLSQAQRQLVSRFSTDASGKLLFDGKEITPDFLVTTGLGDKFLADDGTYKTVTSGTSYDDTQVKADIQTNANNIVTNTNDITTIKTKIGTTAMGTTATDVTGAVAEINGNQLDTVSFSADYKNIVLNRKNGTNPYTIPIAAIINHAKLIELADVDVTDIGNGKTLIYDAAAQKHKYVSSSGTDELVKMDAASDAHYLDDLIDNQTIVNDNGILKVKKLDGQEVTITEINYLKGLTMNVMELVNMFSNGGVKIINTPVATYADLLAYDKTSFIDGISYLVYVLADETHDNAKTTYLIDKDTATPTYFGFAGEHRDFTTSPIDLASEVTGKLGTSNIDVDSLWALLTVDDTYKTLTATDNIFGTHGAKNMYDELTTSIGAKANATDLTTHTDDTDIHITSVEREAWNNKANDNEVIKKADIKTTLDENSTNDDVYGGKAIFDAIKKNCVGKETVLYDKTITGTGTYTLADNVDNYDLIVINHIGVGTKNIQSITLSKNEISNCIISNEQIVNKQFICVYGHASDTNYISGYFDKDKIIINSYLNENIASITGYKFGQVTVQNTITNPSPAASYSTDEQLTGGTWVDGKPIYRKVFTGLKLPFTSTEKEWGTLSTRLDLDYDTLINVDVYRDGYKIPTIIVCSLKPITYNIGMSWGNCNILVVEYTKTTDA